MSLNPKRSASSLGKDHKVRRLSDRLLILREVRLCDHFLILPATARLSEQARQREINDTFLCGLLDLRLESVDEADPTFKN